MFRGPLIAALRRSDRSKGGRPPFDPVMMFKILVLQALYSLSDEATEFQIKDRLSFQRFLGLGLEGRVPDAITAVFPEAIVQTCIVHLLRNSMDFVSWKHRKPLAGALKGIYRAVDAKAAEEALTAFEASEWGQRYPAIGQSWRRAWSEVIPFFAFPEEVRRIIYTTNAIEALNAQLRRAVRSRGHFPSDEAATKLLYLILSRSEKEWRMPPREWSMAKAQFAVLFGERFIKAMAA